MTDIERKMLHRVRDLAIATIDGHNDNTGASCRIDLQGHDCCHTCNDMQTMMEALDKEDEAMREWYRRTAGSVPAELPSPLRGMP